MAARKKLICLFDIDGTITKPRQLIEPEMKMFLRMVHEKVPLALVGGSDLVKIVEQMGDPEKEENGLVAYSGGQLIGSQTFVNYLGEEKTQRFINFCLRYIADLNIPVKRGTFIEFRKGMLNVSPIGRNCSQAERDAFNEYDQEHHVRQNFVEQMQQNFPAEEYGLKYSIGGQISIDVFPIGWDKTYCLKYLVEDGYEDIHFFGDKTSPGGNDYEIFVDNRTIGHHVNSPDDTKAQLTELVGKLTAANHFI